MDSSPPPELPIVRCADAAEWEQWLAAQPADSPGVWLQIAKKGCEPATVTYDAALDSAICFGWIDGQKRCPRRHLLAAALHAAGTAEQVVADQP